MREGLVLATIKYRLRNPFTMSGCHFCQVIEYANLTKLHACASARGRLFNDRPKSREQLGCGRINRDNYLVYAFPKCRRYIGEKKAVGFYRYSFANI